MMGESSISPKRKASRVIESPSKRVTWANASDAKQKVPGVPKDRISVDAFFDIPDKKLVPDIDSQIDIASQLLRQQDLGSRSALHIETAQTTSKLDFSAARHRRDSSLTDNTENGENDDEIHVNDMTPIEDLLSNIDVSGKLPVRPTVEITPPPGEFDDDVEGSFPSSMRKVGEDHDDARYSAADGPATDDNSGSESPYSCPRVGCGNTKNDNEGEFEFLLSAKEFVAVRVIFTITPHMPWAESINVSCTYNGITVASASAHLISRELIRGDFYERMNTLGLPTSNRISELFDHHGYFRWSIKEYYLRIDPHIWDNVTDKGPLLQIDEITVNNEWRDYALGSLMISSLLGRAQRPDYGAKLAYVLLTTGSFWNVEETGIEAFDKSDVWARQNHECFFLEHGFTQVAESSWYVADITDEDDYAFVEKEGKNIIPKEMKSVLPIRPGRSEYSFS